MDSDSFLDGFISTVQNQSLTKLKSGQKKDAFSVVMKRFTRASCSLWQHIEPAKTSSHYRSVCLLQNMVCLTVSSYWHLYTWVNSRHIFNSSLYKCLNACSSEVWKMGEWRKLRNLSSSYTQEGWDMWGCNIQGPVRMVEFSALNCLNNLVCMLWQAFSCLNNQEILCILWTQIFFIIMLTVVHHCIIPLTSKKYHSRSRMCYVAKIVLECQYML
jgi:hypothetical protein